MVTEKTIKPQMTEQEKLRRGAEIVRLMEEAKNKRLSGDPEYLSSTSEYDRGAAWSLPSLLDRF